MASITFYEQAKLIRGGLQTNFTISSRPLNSLLPIIKNILFSKKNAGTEIKTSASEPIGKDEGRKEIY
jgi:hypothetical protein